MFENIIMHWNKLLTREWFSADIFKERFNPFWIILFTSWWSILWFCQFPSWATFEKLIIHWRIW